MQNLPSKTSTTKKHSICLNHLHQIPPIILILALSALSEIRRAKRSQFPIYQNTATEARKYFQASQSYFVDARGNQSETYEVYASANRLRVEQIQPNIPMKGFIKFKVEEVDFPIIKHLNLKFSYVGNQIGKPEENVIFQNIPVTWK